MVDFKKEENRESFSHFLMDKMQGKHQTIEGFAAKAKVDIRTLRSYLDGSFPSHKLSQIYTFLEELGVEFSEFERYLNQSQSEQGPSVQATSGPTININTGNTIENSPIGTQGNITINNYADEKQ